MGEMSRSELNDELARFARAIVQGDELSSHINGRYSAYMLDTAIEVYRNNYRGNLQDALAGAYPVVKQLVGDDFFRYMARLYIGLHPSSSANLYHYGAELAEFLTDFEPAQALSYLPDVAALEWAVHQAVFAADVAPVDLGRLAQIPAENYDGLLLHIHPACRLVRSCYPVSAIWQAHQSGADEDFHIDTDNKPCIALVSRHNNVVRVDDLSEADACFLQQIQEGVRLGVATASTLERYPNFDLQAALLNWFTRDVLCDFSMEDRP